MIIKKEKAETETQVAGREITRVKEEFLRFSLVPPSLSISFQILYGERSHRAVDDNRESPTRNYFAMMNRILFVIIFSSHVLSLVSSRASNFSLFNVTSRARSSRGERSVGFAERNNF